MDILITGGAGYIGSHIVKNLLEDTTHKITVIDNLSTGYQDTIKNLQTIRNFTFIEEDLNQFEKIKSILDENNFNTVFHFAASIVVSESVTNPLKYYMNNTVNTANLIQCAVDSNIEKFIFSSTAAVYGEPQDISINGISENSAKNPINPYGMSKLMSENILQDAAKTNKILKYVIFRYFNVAGASEDLSIGESHEPETHLIPLIAKTALGIKDEIMIYGDDYKTHDGSNVRDYIHILDLANAHIQAIEYLNENDSNIFNCGYGKGYSVKEVVQAMKNATELNFKAKISSKRLGDPAILVADNSRILSKMDWKPKYNNIESICKSSYDWENKKRMVTH